MPDLNQIQFVTRHYWELHGLRWVILGIVALFAAFHDAGWISQSIVLWVVLPVGVALFLLTIPYYRRVFGDLKPNWHAPTVRGLRIANGAGSLAFLAGLLADQMFETRLLLLPLGFAFWLFTRYLAARPFRAYLAYIAASIAALDLVRALVPLDPLTVWSQNGFVTWLLVGCALIALGYLDHRLLTLILRPVREEPEASVHA